MGSRCRSVVLDDLVVGQCGSFGEEAVGGGVAEFGADVLEGSSPGRRNEREVADVGQSAAVSAPTNVAADSGRPTLTSGLRLQSSVAESCGRAPSRCGQHCFAEEF